MPSAPFPMVLGFPMVWKESVSNPLENFGSSMHEPEIVQSFPDSGSPGQLAHLLKMVQLFSQALQHNIQYLTQ